jgi:hypothetical protein
MSTEKYAYYPNAPLCCRILRPSYTRIKPVPGLPSMRIWTFQSNTTGIAEYSSDQDFCFPDCAACPQPLQLSHADALMRFFWCYFGTSQVQAGSGFRVAGDTPSRHLCGMDADYCILSDHFLVQQQLPRSPYCFTGFDAPLNRLYIGIPSRRGDLAGDPCLRKEASPLQYRSPLVPCFVFHYTTYI